MGFLACGRLAGPGLEGPGVDLGVVLASVGVGQ